MKTCKKRPASINKRKDFNKLSLSEIVFLMNHRVPYYLDVQKNNVQAIYIIYLLNKKQQIRRNKRG
jgi:hypothetical protein